MPLNEQYTFATTREANSRSSSAATAPTSGHTRWKWFATRLAPSPMSAFSFAGLTGAFAPGRRSWVSQ